MLGWRSFTDSLEVTNASQEQRRGDPPNLDGGHGQPAAPSFCLCLLLNTRLQPPTQSCHLTTRTFTQAHECAHTGPSLRTQHAHSRAFTPLHKPTQPLLPGLQGRLQPLQGRRCWQKALPASQNLFFSPMALKHGVPHGYLELPSQTLFPKPASNLTHFGFKTRKHQQTRWRETDGNNYRKQSHSRYKGGQTYCPQTAHRLPATTV